MTHDSIFSHLLEKQDPFETVAEWMRQAEASDAEGYCAAQLATVDLSGMPNVRTVLVRKWDSKGFVFYTNCNSTKGNELAGNPKAALLFYWPALHRQLRIRGEVEPVLPEEADRYFEKRPRESQIGAHASKQSAPLPNRGIFETALNRLRAQFDGAPVPRPPHWSGYRIIPSELEFWQERTFRLHDRLHFKKTVGDTWSAQLLYP